MKHTLKILLVLAAIGSAAGWFLHQHQIEARQIETYKHDREVRISALALKHNAVTNWEASLPDRGENSEPYSIDVSRALIGSNQQPFLIECNLNDISEKDGKIITRFSSIGSTESLSLKLECTPSQLKVFSGTNQQSDFAVIARCREVQKQSGEDIEFVVTGELCEAIPLP